MDGVGIIRAPRYAVKTELASGKLEPVFQNATQSNEMLRAYFPKSKNLPAKITEFVKFLAKPCILFLHFYTTVVSHWEMSDSGPYDEDEIAEVQKYQKLIKQQKTGCRQGASC